MARCPFAQWDPIPDTTTGGSYTSGPFKIVHHTTEGSTYQSARSAYRAHNSPPHFTVDSTTIYQHIDTVHAARALRNPPGGVETNRDSAVQIEVVAFAGQPKNEPTLRQVARLCRWIEQNHGVPQAWPNGLPRPPLSGHDPGGHNRDAATWNSQGGHYGHCHVPENTHWDPAYTSEEVGIILTGVNGDADAPENIAISLASRANSFSRADDSATPPDPPLVLRLGQNAPDSSEASAVGSFRGRVSRSSPGLVRNSNRDIVFLNDEGNDDDRYMTPRLKEKTDILAGLVLREWPGVKLRVTDAWDEGRGHASTSRHYEGRAVDLTTNPKDRLKLGRLCGLAVEAGFDWVYFENSQHIHASVIRDEDLHDALAADVDSQPPAALEEDQRDIIVELRAYTERLEEEERQLEAVASALSPEQRARLFEIGSHISSVEAAAATLSSVFKR